ncbi:MAG TPA: TetR/AcrR family transcriptional regulator [Candidatus Saccharimonadales bacterium]|nr:TetR/AcrR family transcriptional regulator [Candidatus Saccharimonadales bacterium]
MKESTKPRERIVTTAAKLFYDHGINAVGVAQICEVANVSKRTLYKHFETKDDLVSAAMILLGNEWFDACTSSDSSDPRERIMHVFRMVEQVAEKPDFYGCIFMNTSIELRGTRAPAVEIVRGFKTKLYDYFNRQAAIMTEQSDILAEQLILLYDGCSAWIVMRRKFPTSIFPTLEAILANAHTKLL